MLPLLHSILPYCVAIGLGDSNYANFCAMGKNLNQRLLNLGANAFYEAGFADDGTG